MTARRPDKRVDERLDAMVDALRARPARLDEIAQARVRARLEAAIIDVDLAAVRSVGRWRKVGVAGGVGLAAAAAVIAVVVAARTGGRGTETIASTDHPAPPGRAATAAPPAPPSRAATATDRVIPSGRTVPADPAALSPGPAASDPAADSAAAPASPAAAPSAPVTVAAGESVQLALADAAVTLYGPGRLSPIPDGAVVDAAGMVVDRQHGDAPWSVHYRGTKIVVAHATFTIEGGSHTRVSVIRGEIQMYCPSGLRTVRTGGSAACEPGNEIRATPRRRPPAASPGTAPSEMEPRAPESSAPPPPQAPQPTSAELYATAESALGRGDLDAAQTALLAVVDAAPSSLDAAIALVDLARLAAKRGDTGRALDYLTRLEHHPQRSWVAAPAALLLKSLAHGDKIQALDPP